MAEEGNPIRLFVTHLYTPDESYFRVFEYLESQPNFYYVNLATPDKPPRSKEKEAIREDLRRQMTDAEVVVVLSTLYLLRCHDHRVPVPLRAVLRQAAGRGGAVWNDRCRCRRSCARSPTKWCRGTGGKCAMRSAGRRVTKTRPAGT